jgi:hypothetical protein
MQNRIMAGNLAGAVTARCRTELGEPGRATDMARRPDLGIAGVTHPYIYAFVCMLSIATAIVNCALSSEQGAHSPCRIGALGRRFNDCRERVHIVRFCMLGTKPGPGRSPRRATQAA